YDAELLAAEEERSRLRRELARAARKRKLAPEILADFERLLNDEPLADAERFWAWARDEFTGTVHKAWSDEMVRWVRGKPKQQHYNKE
ncbi:hypothetical protein D6817_04310, partial [Candidatus Pacearchaeota archaeon]